MRFPQFVLLLLIDFTIILIGIRYRKRLPKIFLAADKAALLGIFIGVNLIAISLLSIYPDQKCIYESTPKLVACMLNNNQGLLTLIAIVIAFITVYSDARLKQSEMVTEENKKKRIAKNMLGLAVEEMIDNLSHLSESVNMKGELLTFPSISFDATFALLDSPGFEHCDPLLLTQIYTLKRITTHNKAVLDSRSHPAHRNHDLAILNYAGILKYSCSGWHKIISLEDQAKPKKPQEDMISTITCEDDDTAVAKFDLRIIKNLCLIFLLSLSQHEEDLKQYTDTDEFKWTTKYLEEVKKNKGIFFYTKSSEVSEETATILRAKGARAYCWLNNKPIEGVEIISLRTNIVDSLRIKFNPMR